MKRKKASKPVDRRARILDASLELLSRHDASELTLAEIARAADVPRPLIHYYFPTLDALQIEVVQKLLESLKDHVIEALKEPRNPREALDAYVEAHFDWSLEHGRLAPVWLYFYYLCSLKKPFRALDDLIRTNGRERIAAILYPGIEDKLFALPRGIAVPEMAALVQGLITGNVVMALTETGLDRKKLCKSTVSAIHAWLGVS